MSDIPYSSICVRGPDAFGFLQAQLAADLNMLAPSSNLFAWCNPKGRVICLFRASQTDDGYALALPSDLFDGVVKRMTMFRFRARVEFEPGEAGAGQLGITSSYEDWRLQNLVNGVVEITTAQSERWTPHMLNLDLLGAVSVEKGCYPGQEIVSRTHFRGKTRRRLLRFHSDEPVRVGDKLSDAERDVGEVVNAIDRELLAVVPLDKQDQPLYVGETQLTKRELPYL